MHNDHLHWVIRKKEINNILQKLATCGTDGWLFLRARLECYISIFVQVQSCDTKTKKDIKNLAQTNLDIFL